MQIVNGEAASGKALAGQSINRVKLNRNAAFTSYSRFPCPTAPRGINPVSKTNGRIRARRRTCPAERFILSARRDLRKRSAGSAPEANRLRIQCDKAETG